MKNQSKRSWAVTTLGAFAVLGLSWISAPAAHAADGKELFMAQKCNLCHSIASASITATTKSEKMKGPDLGGVVTEKGVEWTTKWLRHEVEMNGKKHKKELKLNDDDLKALIGWLETQKKA